MFGGSVWVISSKKTRDRASNYMMHHVIDHVVPGGDLCQTSFAYSQIIVPPPWSVASLLSSEALAKGDAGPKG
jgi:hypothetical protein